MRLGRRPSRSQSGKPMTKHKSSDERRDQILTAARQCFIERGYESTRMQDISKQSGLSKGGIYFHFDSKMQVFMSLVDDEYEASMSLMQEMTARPGSGAEKMLALAQAYLREFSAQTDRPNFFVVAGEVALREPLVKQKLVDLQEAYIEVLSAFIDQGVTSGEFRRINARAAAIFLKSLMDGIEANIALGLEIDIEALISAGMDVILHGVRQSGTVG